MANKETRVLQSDSLEGLRQKGNEVSLHLGDNEQLNSNLKDKTYLFDNVTAGDTVFYGNDDGSKTVRFEIKPQETVDNTGGYIILKGNPTIPSSFVSGVEMTQTGGFSCTIVSIDSTKILVKNTTGTFSASSKLTAGGSDIAAAKIVSRIGEAYPLGVVRVYKNGTELTQSTIAVNGFHAINLRARIPLTGNPTVTEFVEGQTVYIHSSQLSTQASVESTAAWYGTILRTTATEMLLKVSSGSFVNSDDIRILGQSSVIAGNKHGAIVNYDTTYGNGIELNTPAAANDDIKIFSMDVIAAINELQDDVGVTENLTTAANDLVLSINEHETDLYGTSNVSFTGLSSGGFQDAIEELRAELGDHNDINNATGYSSTTAVTGIQEIQGDIGDITGLGTTVKSTLVGSINEIETAVRGSLGNYTLTTAQTAHGLIGAVNEIESVFDASTYEISAGSNAFTINSDDFTVNSNGTIKLDAEDGIINLFDNTTQYGSLTNSGGNLVIKSGTSIMLTGSGTNATFNNNLTVENNLEVDGTAGIDGNLRVGANKFNVDAATGDTQIDRNLEVDGTVGVDGNFRVGGSQYSNATFKVDESNGNTQVAGTFNVDSTTTLNGTTIDGDLDLNGSVNVATNAVIVGTVNIDGATDIDSTLNVLNGTTLQSTLDVTGNTTITGILDIGQLNTKFSNRNNVKLALNELHDEVGVGGNAFSSLADHSTNGQTNITNAIQAIVADLGAVNTTNGITHSGGTHAHKSATIFGVLDNLSAAIVSNDTELTTLRGITLSGGDGITTTIGDLTANRSISVDNTVVRTSGAQTIAGAKTFSSAMTVNNNLSVDATTIDFTGNMNIGEDGGSDLITYRSGTQVDFSDATVLFSSAGGVANFGSAFLKLDANINTQMGLQVDRDHISGSNDHDVKLQWDETKVSADPSRAWTVVGMKNDGTTVTSPLVNFYNARHLISSSASNGLTATWTETGTSPDLSGYWDLDVNLNGTSLEIDTDGLRIKALGVATAMIANSAVTTGKIANDAVTLGTKTSGSYVATITGTSAEVEVTGSGTEGRAVTVGLPNDVTIANDLTVTGDLYVNGTETKLNVSTLEVEDTLILAGNNLGSTEPTSGGFGLETKPFAGVHSNAAGGVTGAHSIVYNFATDRWEADGSLILSTATLSTPQIEGSDFGPGDNLTFTAGSGLSESVSGFAVTYNNTDKGSSQAIWKNIATDSGTAVANSNNDTLTISGGTMLDSARSGDTITINHSDTSTLNGPYGNLSTQNGIYVSGLVVDNRGHLTNIQTGNFDTRYIQSFQVEDGDGTELSITQGKEWKFVEGAGSGASIDINWTDTSPGSDADPFDLTFAVTNTDKGSSQNIFKNIVVRNLADTVLGTVVADNNNDTVYLDAGNTGITLSVSASSDHISINHADTSSQANVNNSGNTFIQDLTFDTFGHVTAVTSGSVTVGDGVTTAQVPSTATSTNHASGIVLTGDTNWSANQTGASQFQIAHANTSGQASVDNSNNNVIQDITLDTFGHITAIASKDITSVGHATNADNINIDESNSNTNYQVTFSTLNDAGYNRQYIDSDNGRFNYNPSTGHLHGFAEITATKFDGDLEGNADTATDADNADKVYVTQYSSTTPMRILGSHDGINSQGNVYSSSGIYARMDTNIIYATQFNGALSGNATTATNATNAGHATTANSATNATNATNSSKINIQTTAGNASYRLVFKGAANETVGYHELYQDSGASLYYNPHTNVLTCPTFSGALSGNATTASSTPIATNADYINIDETNTNANYQVYFGANNGTSYQRPYIDTDNAHFNYNPSTNHLHGFAEITATKFDGALEGNADTATNIRVVERTTENVNYHILGVATDIGGTSKMVNGHGSFYWNGNSTKLHAPKFAGDLSSCTGYSYDDLTNKPTIPAAAGNGTITITQTGISNQTFTVNQSGNTTITLADNNDNTTYSEGGGIDINGSNVISVESDQINHIFKVGSSSAGNISIDMQNTGYADFKASGSTVEFRMDASGNFHADGDVIAYSTTTNSDKKLKKNIQKVEGALELVSQLDGVTFNWKKDDRASAGVIAQNVEEVLPSAVKDVETLNSDDTHKVVDYNQLSALFIEAIKELKEENKYLRDEIENLKSINR